MTGLGASNRTRRVARHLFACLLAVWATTLVACGTTGDDTAPGSAGTRSVPAGSDTTPATAPGAEPPAVAPSPPSIDELPIDVRGAGAPRALTEIPAFVERLAVAPETPREGYLRDRFGGSRTGPDGCSTRERVLIDESRRPAQVDVYRCTVVAGDWMSLYDGYTTDDPGELEVDHVVALAEAWDSGAARWSDELRHEFANDIAFDGSLRAVTAASNRAKSDRDPASWQPSSDRAWCAFATDWVNVKVRWALTADEAEVRALRNLLRSCVRPLTP